MFDVGLGEMALIMAIALMAIGPKQLPEVARTVAKFVAEVRRMLQGVSDSLADTSDVAQKTFSDLNNEVFQPTPPPGALPKAEDQLGPNEHKIESGPATTEEPAQAPLASSENRKL